MQKPGNETPAERPQAPRSAVPLVVRQALPGLLVLFVAVRVLRPIQDPDTYWHISAGDLLAQTWDFVGRDPWGAATSRPWIFNQWVPELLMSWTYDRAGLAGVAWLLSVAAVAITLTLWVACRRRASILVSVVLMAVAFLALMGSLTPRPQVVSFALTVVFAHAWLRSAEDGKPRWWLVPLTWLWACSHGLWFIGPLVGTVVLVGLALDRGHPWRTIGRLALVPALGVGIATLTPVGPTLLSSPFQVHGVTRFIAEWQPPALTDVPFVAFLVLLAVPVLSALRAPRQMPWHLILMLGMATLLALQYTRTVPIAAAIVAPVVAASAGSWLLPEEVRRREVAVTLGLSVAGLVVSALLASATATQPASGPNGLDGPIAALPGGTVVCNEWMDGGWLIWKHPKVKVTMDGRAELYSVEHIEAYAQFVAAQPGWHSYPDRVGCEFAILPTTLPVVEALREQDGWSLVAAGDGRVLLRAP